MFADKMYTLDYKVRLYVNDVPTYDIVVEDYYGDVTITDSNANMLDMYLAAAQGEIRLVKDSAANGYSDIFVNVYEIAKVSNVAAIGAKTTIYCLSQTAFAGKTGVQKIIINDDAVASGEADIEVIKNGEKAAVSDIAKDDVIAVSCDFISNASTVTDPKWIKLLVTDATVTGEAEAINYEEETYTIGGNTKVAPHERVVTYTTKNSTGATL